MHQLHWRDINLQTWVDLNNYDTNTKDALRQLGAWYKIRGIITFIIGVTVGITTGIIFQ